MGHGDMHFIEKPNFLNIMREQGLLKIDDPLDPDTFLLILPGGAVYFRYNSENKAAYVCGQIPLEFYQLLLGQKEQLPGLHTPCCGWLLEPEKVMESPEFINEANIALTMKTHQTHRDDAIRILREVALIEAPESCYTTRIEIRSTKALKGVLKGITEYFVWGTTEHTKA